MPYPLTPMVSQCLQILIRGSWLQHWELSQSYQNLLDLTRNTPDFVPICGSRKSWWIGVVVMCAVSSILIESEIMPRLNPWIHYAIFDAIYMFISPKLLGIKRCFIFYFFMPHFQKVHPGSGIQNTRGLEFNSR